MNHNRRRAGLTAKRRGDQFERIIEITCRINQINLIKIPMGAEVRKVKSKNVVKKKASPFDFIATKKGSGNVFFDAKTRQDDSISYSNFWDGKSTQRQVITLGSLHKFGERSGFLVWFRASDRICFLRIDQIVKMKSRTSFGPDDGLKLGHSENFCIERLWD